MIGVVAASQECEIAHFWDAVVKNCKNTINIMHGYFKYLHFVEYQLQGLFVISTHRLYLLLVRGTKEFYLTVVFFTFA